MIKTIAPSLTASLALICSITAHFPAYAGQSSKESKAIVEPQAESRYKFSGWLEAGYTFNNDQPNDNQNFGHLFTDRSNEPLLNQAVLTFERALAPEPNQFDWGFKLQGLFGSDARFIQYFGELDNTMNERVQPDIVEAYLTAHLPILTEGGVDLKIGQFVTLQGAEVITAPSNFFYSHSYIFNFSEPFKHTGLMITTHATPWLDVYTGVVRGANAGFDDNNDVLSFHGGLGVKLFDGKLNLLATTSLGAENDAAYQSSTVNTNGQSRGYYDFVATWKITDKLTSITNANYTKEDGFDAECYGVAQYFTYSVNDYLSVGIRGEIFRDDDGFFVLQSGNNEDYIKLQRGILDNIDPRTVFGGDTTYGAITVGANVKLSGFLKDRVTFRPEVRYDSILDGEHDRPFNDSTEQNQFTASVDIIISF